MGAVLFFTFSFTLGSRSNLSSRCSPGYFLVSSPEAGEVELLSSRSAGPSLPCVGCSHTGDHLPIDQHRNPGWLTLSRSPSSPVMGSSLRYCHSFSSPFRQDTPGDCLHLLCSEQPPASFSPPSLPRAYSTHARVVLVFGGVGRSSGALPLGSVPSSEDQIPVPLGAAVPVC